MGRPMKIPWKTRWFYFNCFIQWLKDKFQSFEFADAEADDGDG